MDFSKDELKEIVLGSYELLIELPSPKFNNSNKKYEIDSRNKLKTLPNALRENDDSAANITHFVKHASYSLPRAERKSGGDKEMLPFLYQLLNKINDFQNKDRDADRNVGKIKYLVGYVNWNIDTVCAIFTANGNDDKSTEKRLHTMLAAELGVIGAEEHKEKIISKIMQWKKMSDNKVNQQGRR